MAILINPRREAYAQTRAVGMAPKDAYVHAGYKGNNNHARFERIKAITSRVTELRAEAANQSRDLSPLIGRMIEMSEKAASLNTAAAMREAKSLLVEAARLKGLLPMPQRPRERELTREEWHAKYAPRP